MAQRRRTPWVWLVVAVLLLAAGAWLMRGAEPPAPRQLEPVNLPTRQTRAEKAKADERRTWLAPAEVLDAGQAPPSPPKDPVLALMPSEVKRGVMVAEVNAILNSELGGLMVQCLAGDDSEFIQELRDAGLDPTRNFDRVAMIDDNVVVTGDFREARWKRLLPDDAVSKGYGRRGELIEVKREDGGVDTFGTWGGQMFLGGGDEASIKGMIDRLDGNAPLGKPVLDDSMAYGEVYGVVAGSFLSEAVAQGDPRLADAFAQAAKQVQVHMDVSHDVGLVADVQGSDPAKVEELRKSLGSALSLARMRAQAEGKTDQAEVLDLARVMSASGGSDFRLQAGIPNEFMKKSLEDCITRRKERAAARRAREQAPAALDSDAGAP